MIIRLFLEAKVDHVNYLQRVLVVAIIRLATIAVFFQAFGRIRSEYTPVRSVIDVLRRL